MADTEKLAKLNKKITELKKRIQLFEGQKKANFEEWEKQKNLNSETISALKKEIKELTDKLTLLKNPSKYKFIKTTQETTKQFQFLVGVKNVEEAVIKIDLKNIDMQKQFDLLQHTYLKREQFFNKLVQDYNDLLAYKNNQKYGTEGIPSETQDEDTSKKLVCHLENNIHRTNVQWMEAEHIRKKYRLIKSSLMTDSEKFEKSLRELEEALTEQQAEIRRLQQVHKEAVGMRDAAKIILQRQEQQTHVYNKAREKQALDFRRQVEERKLELERIERKLFSSGKTLVHQESAASSFGDQLDNKTDQEHDPNLQLQLKTNQMELALKKLMEITGATNTQEVLQRFLSQKESTTRLCYLRTAAEEEKKHLEQQREQLTSELETSKFRDIKDTDVNQEHLEKLKMEIANLKKETSENSESSEQIKKVIESISETLVEIIFKLQEIDETDVYISRLNKVMSSNDFLEFLNSGVQDEDLIGILEEKIKKILRLANERKLMTPDEKEQIENLEMPVTHAQSPTTLEEKPQPLPVCYVNLVTGRTVQSSSTSPGQTSQPIVTDDESEIPSRNYLKQQAVLIVDTKSRRKGFRPTTQRRK